MSIKGAKVIVFGCIPECLQESLAVSPKKFLDSERELFTSLPALPHSFSQSCAEVRYNKQNILANVSPFEIRACQRFDFADEWNNLGFGSIRADDSVWGVATCILLKEENTVASIYAQDDVICTYIGLWNISDSHLLWVNRPVGLVDSQEWFLLEEFISTFDSENSICIPALLEVPFGYDGCVTMRLDCDEDIKSAKELCNLYNEYSVPISLAINASILEHGEHHHFLNDFVSNGGELLSHSFNHPINWGGSYDEAIHQVHKSVNLIESATIEKVNIEYAVSPFHQNPVYSVMAMADSGLKGFIGGIICNDPEYIIARGGQAPYAPEGFITHSQQCMLHGDCMLKGDDSLFIFKQAFNISSKVKNIFGFLDHPFSSRYSYGWESEDYRCGVHSDFINYIKSSGNILFINENDAMNWVRDKNSIEISLDQYGNISLKNSLKGAAVRYKGKNMELTTLVDGI